jgi:hypothetical protein
MYLRKMVKQALRLGLLVVFLVLALIACGGGAGEAGSHQEEANARPLPENNATLPPGEYRSVEFEPSLSFKVGEGWKHVAPELPDKLAISPGGEGGDPLLIFRNLRQVFKPAKSMATPPAVEAPEDMTGWFRHQPLPRCRETGARHRRRGRRRAVRLGGCRGCAVR